MAKPLDVRAAAIVRSDDAPTKDITAIIPELAEARDRELARQRQAEADSVDIALAEPDRDEAAANAARAGRMVQSYADAIAGLEAKLRAREQSDSRQRREAEQAAALAERDEIAERFKATVPALVAKLTAILAEVDANESRMHDAGLREANAEAFARGLPSSFNVGGAELRRFTRMVIPGWDADTRAWPPHIRAPLQDYERQQREIRRKAETNAADREALFGWYRLSQRGGAAISFTARVFMSDGQPTGHTKDRRLWREPWAGSIALAEAERLRELGVTVEAIDQATAEAETAAADAKANEGVYFADAHRAFP